MISVLGVHGVGNYQPRRTPEEAAARLAGAWGKALRRGMRSAADPIDLRVAYYAPHLHQGIAQSAADPMLLPTDAAAKVQTWAEALGAPADVTMGYGTAPIRQIIDWVAREFGLDVALVRAFVAVFFGEVTAYLRAPDSTARLGARTAVAEAIRRHQPDVVIAHSLGSVVAYEALLAHPDLRVDLLMTVGSPLGMPDVVFEYLLPPPVTRGCRPSGVGEWVNVADAGDLVAIPRRLTERFDVDADYEESIHLFDFHFVSNYLACHRVAESITAGRHQVKRNPSPP